MVSSSNPPAFDCSFIVMMLIILAWCKWTNFESATYISILTEVPNSDSKDFSLLYIYNKNINLTIFGVTTTTSLLLINSIASLFNKSPFLLNEQPSSQALREIPIENLIFLVKATLSQRNSKLEPSSSILNYIRLIISIINCIPS